MRRVDHVHIKMADLSHQRVPKAWNQSTSPAWTIQLNSALKIWPRLLNSFPTVLDRCVLCSRGAFVQSGTYFPKQRHHIVDSAMPGTAFTVCDDDSMAATPALPDLNLSWTNATTLTVGGRGFNDTATFWERLPTAADGKVNGGVYGLSKDSAGMSVRFKSSAATVGVRYRLRGATTDMWHMPSTGMSGADLYVFDASNATWRWVGTCRVIAAGKGQPLPYVASAFEFPHATRPPGFDGEVRYKLHLPTYNGVADGSLEIGVDKHAVHRAGRTPTTDTPDSVRPIVWYGTSIAQGCCASRPGQIFTNQIARRLTPNRDVINLGFSGSGVMDPGVVSFLATIDASVIVVDCSWNMSPSQITTRAPPLVGYLRSHGHPTTPIIFVEGTTGGQQWISNSSLPETSGVIGGINEAANRVALRAVFAAMIAKSPADKNLHLVNGDSLFHHRRGGTEQEWEPTFEDPTVGGVHPTDLGHTRMSEFWQVFLPPLLAASDDAHTKAAMAAAATTVATTPLTTTVMHEADDMSMLSGGNEDENVDRLEAKSEEDELGSPEQLPLLLRHKARHHTPWVYDRQGGQQHGPTRAPPPPPAHKKGYTYTDFRHLHVHGRAFNDTAPGHYYSRLPLAAKADVTQAVWQLSLDSTNQHVRFTTDAPSVHFTYRTQQPCKGMWHMPTSGTCYLDLYAYDTTVASWRHVGPIGPGFGGDAGGSPFYDLTAAKALPSAFTGKNTTYLLYLPVRNTLVDDSGAVGVPTGSYIAGSDSAGAAALGDTAPQLRGGKRRVVWYGTSIQQGGVASRAGNLYDAIIGRRLSREVLNFGFSGNGHEDIGVAKYLATLDAAVIVLDCLPNMVPATVAAKTVPLVKYLRANGHASTPIVLAEIPPKCESNWFQTTRAHGAPSLAKSAAMNDALRQSYENLTASGDTNLHYVYGSQILAGQEGEGAFVNPTVGGTHPADLGQYDMADFYSQFLPTVIKN
jgi:hypothetical protein